MAISGMTILVPYLWAKSMPLICRLGTLRRVPNLQLSSSDLTKWQGTRMVVPAMADRWNVSLAYFTSWQTLSKEIVIIRKHQKMSLSLTTTLLLNALFLLEFLLYLLDPSCYSYFNWASMTPEKYKCDSTLVKLFQVYWKIEKLDERRKLV